MKDIDVLIISPGLLEAGTCRGGGCEITDYNVALQLSNYFRLVILSPYYNRYLKTIMVNESFSIEQIPFPAIKNYPPKSNREVLASFLLTWIYSILVAVKVWLLIIRNNLKIIIVHNCQTAMISVILAKIANVKIIYAEGNITPWADPYIVSYKRKLLPRIWYFFNLKTLKFICRWAHCIRTQSESIKQGMVGQGIDPAKIQVIPGGIDPNEFVLDEKINHENFVYVGFIGRLTEIKGAPLLLDIIHSAEKELPNVKFLMFGDGPYRDQFLGFANIEHIGMVPRDQLGSWLSKVQILLFFQKELGRAELESMAAGKGIIACNVGETPNFIKHQINGLLCIPTKDSYIEAIRSLSNNPILLKKISANARKMAIRDYSWGKIGLKWLSMCKFVLKDSE